MSKTRGLGVRGYIHPRTARKPITLKDYLDMTARDVVVRSDLNPEFVAWHDRVSRKKPKYR